MPEIRAILKTRVNYDKLYDIIGEIVATAKAITWLVSDIIQWHKSKELVINDAFQRHSVWTPQAKTLLIDTILNELPLPKIYIRTKIDAKKQVSIKEIVDGQQRVRSIVEFANNEYALNKKSEKYNGYYYSDLSDELQERFLGYAITAEQLLNATDDDVIDIFARLNSYTVSLNAAEKRHAAYQTELKFFIRKISIKFRWLIEKYGIFTVKQRFRMADDEFFAELVRLIIYGVSDGGADKLKKFYDQTKDDFFNEQKQDEVERKVDEFMNYLDTNLSAFLKGSLGKHYHIYSIAAAYFHITKQTPLIPGADLSSGFKTKDEIDTSLANLEMQLDDENFNSDFTKASRSSTQRLANRIVRAKTFAKALGQ